MKNKKIAEEGIQLIKEVSLRENVISSTNTVVKKYDTGHSKMTAHLIAERLTDKTLEHDDLLQLAQIMEISFDNGELEYEVCYALNISFGELKGQTLTQSIRDLIYYMKRRQRLQELIVLCQKLRPKQNWETSSESLFVKKLDTAIVIALNQPILPSVAEYLDSLDIEANMVLCRHVEAGKFFSVYDNWEEIVKTYTNALMQVSRDFTGSRLHLFLAGPGALLFAFGCISGTVHEMIVYHYEKGTYHEVLPLTRRLRQTNVGW